MTPFQIQTPRLLMREWAEEDQAAFVRLVSAPQVLEWSGPDDSGDFEVPFIERMRRNQLELGWALWAVELLAPRHDEPAGPIGWAGFGTESLPDPELAWTFLPAVWGRGYATEAGITARDHGFEALGMERMVSIVDVRNVASARVATKVGLVHRGMEMCHGVEHLRFELTRDEWVRQASALPGRSGS